ncbi:MAG: CocE/NonD family hydrolase [Candidatus Hydrogenedentes bacterium]|nr:CocE/NonD family hydrolase [Candidatus Hydrogenedentota bacterium]
MFTGLIAAVVISGLTGAADQMSKPFEYAGYSTPDYAAFTTFSQYVPMPDRVRLAVDVHLPAGGPDKKAFPVILEYLPYQRSTVDPATGKVSDATDSKEGRFFLSYGYALVRADMRGTGSSSGWLLDFMPRLAEDGAEVVRWIHAQPWCDGNIGMKGSSYLGWSQMATAAGNPPGLKCIAPEYIPLDGYTGEVRPGGIFSQSFFEMFSAYINVTRANEYKPDAGALPTKPADDEDGDGDYADEIPVDADKDGSFLDETPPTYADGVKRSDVYYAATLEHVKGNYDFQKWAHESLFLDSATPLKFTLQSASPGGCVPRVRNTRVPVYHWGGWFDAFARGTFELYCTMADANPSKLVVAPSYHDFVPGPFWKYFGVENVEDMYLAEHLRFYDRYLKGIQNGIDLEPPICIYVMNGGGWRFEREWPLARQEVRPLYIDSDHRLSPARSSDGTDTYKADYAHDGRYAENKANRSLGISAYRPDTVPIRTEHDKKCLVYTSAPMENDTEVTGHPIARLWLKSTAGDGDFYVYLEEVDESGEALLVTEGQLRAGFASLADNDAMINVEAAKINVLPDLPWHGFRKQDYNPNIFANGAEIELVIDLQPTSWVFRKGRRIRLSVACADFPTYELHPALCPNNSPDSPGNVVPTISLLRDPTHPSRLELPIIPK